MGDSRFRRLALGPHELCLLRHRAGVSAPDFVFALSHNRWHMPKGQSPCCSPPGSSLGRSGTPGERVIVSDSESSGDQLLGLQACIHVLTATYYFTVCERVGFSMRAWAPRARLCYCSAVFWGHQPEQRFALCVSVEVGAM